MKIGLYFGSFNPIHTGHLIIANHVANFTDCNQIWFVISPQNPLKSQHSLLNQAHRKHLVDLAIGEDNRFRTSTIEFNLPKPSYTIDTLTHLKEKYPDFSFAIIMGSDSYSNIKRWKNWELLVKENPIIVFARPGYPIEETLSHKTQILTETPLLSISSTYIRNLLAEKKSIKYLVSEKVEEEIVSQNYYTQSF